ncbi:MAG: TonB-dependent receptor [Ignavibacteria bacterium]|jgi:outer membrane receptor protein involved in Fe transport
MKKNFFWVLKMAVFYSFLGLLLQGVVVSMLFASTAGQNLSSIRVTMNAANVSFEEALEIITEQTNFKFSYNKQEVPLNESVTIDVTDEPLYDLLKGLAGQYNLVFQRINNQIVIKKANFEEYNEPVVVIQQTGSIKGKITDAKTGEALMGANIMLKETNTGVAANENGEYSLEKLSPGNYTLVIKYIGYTTKEETVEVAANRTIELNIELDPSAFDLNEVVVTGSMVETKKKTLGTAITVLKAKDLEEMNTTSLLDIFKDQQVAGVTTSDMGTDSQNQKIFIRGSNQGHSYIQPTKILVDGVEVQTSVMTNISSQNIERIEIIRGPQASTLYGSEAAGGVIQIFTKKGSATQEGITGSISTRQGITQSKYDPSALWDQSYNGSLSGGLIGGSFNLGVSYMDKDGFVDNSYRKNLNVSFGFQKKLLDNLNMSLITRITNRKQGYAGYAAVWYGLYKEDKLPNSTSYMIDPNDYYQGNDIILGLNASYVYSDWWEHQLTIGYNKSVNDRYEFPDYFSASDTMSAKNNNRYTRSTFRYLTNIKLPRMDFFEPSITAGFEYVEPDFQQIVTNYITTDVPYVSISSGRVWAENTVTRAFFGQTKLGFYDKLFITAGVRSDYNSNNGANYSSYTTSPRVGFSYLMEPTNGWVIKARGSWGEGIQSPTLIMKSGNGSTIIENLDLGPQKTKGWEIGADQYFLDGSLYFEFTYYYQHTDDLIGLDNPNLGNNSTVYQYVNMGEVENKGVEVMLKYTSGAMDISGNVSYNDNELLSMPELKSPSELVGKPLALSVVPQVAAGFSFNYNLNELLNIDKEHNTSVGFNVSYTGKRWARDYEAYYADVVNGSRKSMSNYLKWFDGFAKVNLSGRYQLTKILGIGLQVRNLFNSYEQPFPTYYVTGRETSLQLNMNF